MTPFSVMIAVTWSAGVTSKAGLAAGTPSGTMRRPPMTVTSSSALSSMGISVPFSKSRSKVVEGAAT